eukprot:s5847_g6.t1
MEMVCPVCNELTWKWTSSQKAKADARAGWIYSCKTCRMENRMHPHAGYHMKRFYQYFVRLDSDPVGNPIGSLGLRMVHQTLASDWTTEARGRLIESFLASEFANEAARGVFLNFLYHLHEACVLASMDSYTVLRCRNWTGRFNGAWRQKRVLWYEC